MILGGLNKNSLIEYPGKISCILFTSGCNFDCPYCHNPDLAKGHIRQDLTEKEIYHFLEAHKGFLDGVVISGGEPTIQKDLISICRKIKQLDYAIKLDTNGSRPSMLQHLIRDGLVDYIAMDIKTDPSDYAPFFQKSYDPDTIYSSIRIIMTSAIPYEFRTTCVKPFVDEHKIGKIAQIIRGAGLYALQRFQHTQILHPQFFANSNHKNTLFKDDEFMNLKSIADLWVKECIIR